MSTTIKSVIFLVVLHFSLMPQMQASWQKKACWSTAAFTLYASYKFLHKSLQLSEQHNRLGFHAVLQKNENPQAAGIAAVFAFIATVLLGRLGAQYK